MWGGAEFLRLAVRLARAQGRHQVPADVPINLGSGETVAIDGLVGMVEEIAGIRLKRTYRPEAPKGVDGRSSDNSMILARLGWQPSTPLRAGIEKTYAWIYDQYVAREKRLRA